MPTECFTHAITFPSKLLVYIFFILVDHRIGLSNGYSMNPPILNLLTALRCFSLDLFSRSKASFCAEHDQITINNQILLLIQWMWLTMSNQRDCTNSEQIFPLCASIFCIFFLFQIALPDVSDSRRNKLTMKRIICKPLRTYYDMAIEASKLDNRIDKTNIFVLISVNQFHECNHLFLYICLDLLAFLTRNFIHC